MKMVTSVLVLSHQGLGDIISSIPIYNALRTEYPDATITSTVKGYSEKRLLESQGLSDLFIMSDIYSMTFVKRFFFLLGFLFKNYSIVIAPVGINIKYAVIIKCVSFSKKMIAIKSNGILDYFVSNPVRINSKAKRVFNNNLLLNEFSNKNSFPRLQPIQNLEYLAKKFSINKSNFLIGIHPGSGVIEKHKRWPIENYAELIRLFMNYDNEVNFILFGVESEISLCNGIYEKVNFSNQPSIYNLCGKTSIDESLSIMSICNLFVSADTGLMHVASALGIKTISMFGPTSSNEIAPYWNNALVINQGLPCSPCYPDLLQGCGNNKCMSKIQPINVFNSIKGVL